MKCLYEKLKPILKKIFKKKTCIILLKYLSHAGSSTYQKLQNYTGSLLVKFLVLIVLFLFHQDLTGWIHSRLSNTVIVKTVIVVNTALILAGKKYKYILNCLYLSSPQINGNQTFTHKNVP